MGNFDFLEDEYPEISTLGNQADAYKVSDPNASLIKLGMIGETIVDMIYAYTGIEEPPSGKAFLKINWLGRDGYLPQQIVDVLHLVRKVRNKAVHGGYNSAEEAAGLVRIMHSVVQWFAMAYGTNQYELQEYLEEPTSTDKLTRELPMTTESEDENMARIAAKKAKAAPKIDKETRLRRVREIENQRPKTEAETRMLIDAALRDVGWEADTETIRYSKGVRPKEGHNYAIAEWPTGSGINESGRGNVDYALFVNKQMVGTAEAKAESKDILSVLDVQCKDYSSHIRQEDYQYCVISLQDKPAYQVPFTFATNGRPYLEQYKEKSGIWALDLRDSANAPQPLRGWPSPKGLIDVLKQDIDSANVRLAEDPRDFLQDEDGLHLRDYQLRAVEAVERAVIEGKRSILLAMATGTGKTRTALAMIYRFLKSGRFRRILFLVDRTTLGEQAEEAFKDVKIEQLLALDQIYNVSGLDSDAIDDETRISVATVQSMVKRVLYGSEEDGKPAITDFDLVIIDEAHRGYILDKEMTEEEVLYRDQREYQSRYRETVEYFDAVKIALTATPALHTTQIFGAPVFQYTYREAVIAGWLADHDVPHSLKTRLSAEGIHFNAGETVAIYDPETNDLINGAELEDELDFDVDSFNKKVIDENFDRTVLTEIAHYFDPESPNEQGKMLIYAVDDPHADRIVRILKEIYSETGVNNDAIMKITNAAGGGSQKRVRDLVRRFKNESYPSIAVTVDLLTTGIDVPPITTLVFMRRVRSRILFEQMLGRATRLCPEIHKTHFEIFDPVGVYDALEPVTTMKPVSVDPSATIAQLIEGFNYADTDTKVQAQIDRLIAKTQRRLHGLSEEQRRALDDLAGFSLGDFVRNLHKTDPQTAKQQAQDRREALQLLDEVRINRGHGILISDKPDELISHTRDYGEGRRPEDYLDSFSQYVTTHVNEVAALNLCVTRPTDLTRETLRELTLTLEREGFTVTQLNRAVSETTNVEMVADIISLVRRYAIGSPLVSHEERIHRAVERLCAAHDFSQQELTWLSRIERYLVNDSVLNVSVFDADERFRSKGGFKKMNKVFRGKLEGLIMELNGYLYDDKGRAA